MTPMIREITAELRRADDQSRDWYAWATNQLAHGVVGGAGVALLMPVLAPPLAALLVPPLYYIGWERGLQRGRDLVDSLTDTGHVAAGAALLATAASGGPWAPLVVCLAWAVALRVGVARRIRAEDAR